MESNSFFVTEENVGVRLDKLLVSHFPKHSRTYFHSLIEKGLVLINGERVKKSESPNLGDEIEIEFILTPEIDLKPENIPLDILFEDDDLIAINKPSGMVVHPGAGNPSHTFVNALLYHCKGLERGNTSRPGIIHRLDKETSGVLVAAKNERAHQGMVSLFAERKIEKQYLALCIGHPQNQLIEGNIGRHPQRRQEMAVLKEGGKESKTRCYLLSFNGKISLVRLFPETGRTHQLRVHLKSTGTPILGDPLYGNLALNAKWDVKRQLLHAEKLKFKHPLTQEEIYLKAPLPDDMLFWILQMECL